ncbi:lipid particle protein [Polychaeton citri CBS 116435]|uniref:Lipid particle protein n=1 Tax=Polychaeton citri CBS 116435 TaxID=1314669 RepID=A0A9P4QI30_9PEZI|nr:lipid particle protein [Polychaeton citri CBS 116435]
MPAHLCVLIHGLWGNPAHLDHLRDALKSHHDKGDLHILVAKSNADSFTYDGINIGGERITNEIEQTLVDLERKNGEPVGKLSIVGYSLGGLVARYTIGLLYQDGIFDKIQPVNFTTFATPHLGVRNPSASYFTTVFNTMGAKTLSASGQQLFLTDTFEETGKPLLSVMADENNVFMRGLASFKNKSLYANIINDRSVPYFTSGISRIDPFEDLEKVNLRYLQDTDNTDEPVLLDPARPAEAISEPKAAPSLAQSISDFGRNLPFYAAFTLLVPIGISGFLANSVYQNYTSAKRMKMHLEGKSGINTDRYRIKSFFEEAQAAQTRLQTQLAHTHTQEYLPTPPPEPADVDASPFKSSFARSASNLAELEKAQSKSTSPFPTLALTPEQFEMIDSLDRAGIQKFPVHISKVRHTHAAIVVRTNKDSFSEGRVVSKHWAKRFEV